MRISLSILGILFFVSIGRIEAQYFERQEQPEGHPGNKNITVDHATGVLRYNLPLFEMKSGNFKLPLSLSYSGSGVQVNQLSSVVGLNWALSCGGIITKSVRNHPSATKLQHNLQEDDIYTLQLNGKTVPFIIVNGQVEPLEKTNIIIQRVPDDNWQVTDDYGVVYRFDIKEFTKNANLEGKNPEERIKNHSYVSSWYPSEIQIPNADKITLDYSPGISSGVSEAQDSIRHFTFDSNVYYYGKSMRQHVYDFSAYQTEYDRLLREARIHLASIQLEHQILFAQLNDSIRAMDGIFYEDMIRFDEKILGVLSDIERLTPSIMYIENLINTLNYNYPNTALTLIIGSIRSLLSDFMSETRSLNYNMEISKTGYTVFPRFLKKIHCKDKEIEFFYRKGTEQSGLYHCVPPDHSHPIGYVSENYYLDSIRVLNKNKMKMEKIVFIGGQSLQEIRWEDKNNALVKTMAFTYYPLSLSGNGPGNDGWGYFSKNYTLFNGGASTNPQPYTYEIDTVTNKAFSLRKITLPGEGEIEVVYEPNRFSSGGTTKLYGGLRVKQLIFKDGSGTENKINYKYPHPGLLVYDRFSRIDTVSYPEGFTDYIYKEHYKYWGNVYINRGNNGLFYDYVQEEIVGKGTNTYYFCIPQSSSHQPDSTFPFWLCGLPLAKAQYDNTGNLVRLVKYKYLSDMGGNDPSKTPYRSNVTNQHWFEQSTTAYDYGNTFSQAKLYSYFMDRDEMYSFYQGKMKSPDMGYEPLNMFYWNIEPRTGTQRYESSYKIHYGGKTLLTEIVEYAFSSPVSSSPSLSHITATLPNQAYLLSRIRYAYDGLSTVPVKETHFQSNGEELTIFRRTPLHFTSSVDPVINKMLARNMINIPIKKLTLLKKPGISSYTLLSEEVCLFKESINLRGEKNYIPDKTYRYSQGTYSLPGTYGASSDVSLFTAGRSAYREEAGMVYKEVNGIFRMAEQHTPSQSIVSFQDPLSGRVILSSNYNQSSHLDVKNTYPATEPRATNIFQDGVAVVERFDGFVNQLYANPYMSTACREYCYNGSFQLLMNILFGCYDNEFSYISGLIGYIDDTIVPDFRSACENISEFSNFFGTNGDEDKLIDIVLALKTITSSELAEFSELLNNNGTPNNAGETLMAEVPASAKMNLTFLIKPVSSLFSTSYKLCSGANETSVQTSGKSVTPGRWQLVTFTLSIPQGISAVKADIPVGDSQIGMGLLTPAGIAYEAVSYNADGLIFCQFNQNGQMERFEYDAANRIKKVYDQDGNMLKEYEYNL